MSMSLTGTLETAPKENSIMSRSIDGSRGILGSAQSPARTQSTCSTLERK